MKLVLFGSAVLGVLLVSGIVSADEKPVHTLPTTTVVGKPQRPLAAIEVSRARMKVTPTTPTLASVTAIQNAARKDPF